MKTLKEIKSTWSHEAEASRFVNSYMVKALELKCLEEYKKGRPLRELLELCYNEDNNFIYEDNHGSMIICKIPSKEVEAFLRGMEYNNSDNVSVTATHDLNNATINNIKELIDDFKFDNPIFQR